MKIFAPLFLLLALCSCVTTNGVAPPSASTRVKNTYQAGRAQLSLLFAVKGAVAEQARRFELKDVELHAGDRWYSLLEDKTLSLDPARIHGGQRLLNRLSLPPGNYDRVRLSIGGAGIIERPLNPSLTLAADDSSCLFITWDLRRAGSIVNGKNISIHPQHIPLTTELAYVSCPEINTIYIIRTDNNQICGAWGVSGSPGRMAVFKNLDELIVLARKRREIRIIELSSGRLRDVIKIPMLMAPAFMVVDKSGRYAFLLDRQDDYVSKIDLRTGALVKRVRVAAQPDFLDIAADDTLELSSAISQKVVLLDAATMNTLAVIADSGGPQGLMITGHYLYIAEKTANNVARYNLESGGIERHAVGLGPERLTAYNNYVYVTNLYSGTLSMLIADQNEVFRTIRVGPEPGEMAVSSSRDWLYITTSSGLSVLDLTTHRLTAVIDLQAKPLDVVVIQ